jgi:hypothetical protein
MGVAIDTVFGTAHNAGTTATALTMASGDSLTIRNYNPPASCKLERISRAGTASSKVVINSPLLYDNVQALHFITSESPSQFLFPKGYGQAVQAQDVLSVTTTGGTNEYDGVLLEFYYTDLPGASARLYMPSDVMPLIDYYTVWETDCTSGATPPNWVDTALNTTETRMKANSDHAVLGYITDVACAAVAIKGPDTSNLRIGGPGTNSSRDTSEWFTWWSERQGTPHIPVINSANIGATYVSVADVGASTAVKVQLILGHLSHNIG